MRTGDILRHSFLNLLRNKRRSLMILFILSASTMIVFITNCYLAQMYRGMRLGYMHQNGSLQVARRGFWDVRRQGDLLMGSRLRAAATELIKEEPELAGMNPELGMQGLIGTESRSTIVNGMGVEAGRQGGYAGYILLKSGFLLDGGDPEGLLIGKPAAERLGVEAGDYISVMSTTADGTINLASARVVGIVSTGMDQADAYYCASNLSFVQELRATDGIDRLLVFLRTDADLQAAKERLEKRFLAEGLDLEIKTWAELSPFYFELESLYNGIFLFIKAIISVLVFLAVLEIISMSFFERFRELGTLRSIGNTRGEILIMLLGEVILYALVGIGLGAGVGAGIGSFLNGLNLSWTPPGSTNPVPFGFFIRLESLVSPLVIVFGASVFAAVFPAVRSANKQIVEVLKYE